MEDDLVILYKGFFCGCAALGFAILFNVDRDKLLFVWIGGVITGLIKYSVMVLTPLSIIYASFFASLGVGIYCLFISRALKESQLVFAVPSVIPLVPGVYAYRTMLGLISLSREVDDSYSRVLSETVRNGAMTLFIIIAFSVGIILTIQAGKRMR